MWLPIRWELQHGPEVWPARCGLPPSYRNCEECSTGPMRGWPVGMTLPWPSRKRPTRPAYWTGRLPSGRCEPTSTRERPAGRPLVCSTNPPDGRHSAGNRPTGESISGGCWESSPVSNLLVTGGAGFIGANFLHYWLEQHATDHLVVL